MPGTKISIYSLLTVVRRAAAGHRRHHAPRVLSDAARGRARAASEFLRGRAPVTTSRSRACDRRRVSRSMPIALNHPYGSVGYRIDLRWLVVGLRLGHRAVQRGAAQAALSSPVPSPSSAGRSRRRSATMREALDRASCVGVDTVDLRHALPARRVRALPALRPLDAGPGARGLRRCRPSAASCSTTTRRAHSDDQMDQIAATYQGEAAPRSGIEVADVVRRHDAPDRRGRRRRARARATREDPLLGRARLVRDVRAATTCATAATRASTELVTAERRAPARWISAPARPSSPSS